MLSAFTGIVGALIYYFVVERKFRNRFEQPPFAIDKKDTIKCLLLFQKQRPLDTVVELVIR